MSINTKELVNIPDDKGIVTKTAGKKGEKYVYKQTRFYRNDEGKPRNDAVVIGKLAPDRGKMYPNPKYFEIYNVHLEGTSTVVQDYGYTYLLMRCAQDIGLYECLKSAFGEYAMDIIVMAAYIIREGNSMDGIDDWQVRNKFSYYNKVLNSQSTSRIFATLTCEQRVEFFKKWVQQSLTDGTVCYDVTSISSYSQEMINVERGYNRDGDDLSQFNLGMFCDEVNKIPLYYDRYSGSLTDRTNLSHVLANAKSVGIEKVKMVLDGGFWGEEALQNLNELCESFSVGMPKTLKDAEKAIAELGQDMAQYTNKLRNHNTYCVQKETVINKVKGKILLYFDVQNRVTQCKDLSEYIERLKSELIKLKRYPKSKLSRFQPYFKITKHETDSGFDFEVDIKKIEKLRKNKGYFLIFSTDITGTPDDILDYYRGKDADEKIFAQIKVDMDGSRIRTHNEETTDGKTFVTFIACILRSYLMQKLTGYLAANSTSMKKTFSLLSNIITISTNREPIRLIQALTKKQKDILSAFAALQDFEAIFK